MTMTNMKWRNHRWYKIDPLVDDIKPALLNSVGIEKYAEKGCLMERIDRERLKPASYEMKFLGRLYDYKMHDGKLKQRCRYIWPGRRVTLPRNSITYLWMEEKLLLPEYIAARFNLHIRYVHKGILLGTGPLVDPGFFGNLLIPLHNLTDNDYEVTGGDGIIWVEFTKVSGGEVSEGFDPKPFPEGKYIKTANQYLEKAKILRHGVQSAIKGALDNAEKNITDSKEIADDARKKVEVINKRLENIGWRAVMIGVITIAITIGGIWYTGLNLISEAASRVQSSENQILSTKIVEQDSRIDKLEIDVEKMKMQLQK